MPRRSRSATRSPSRSNEMNADWGRSPSRSRSKSVPPRRQPQWMVATAERLDVVAEAAETAVEQGGEALRALYAMTPRDVSVAASSQPQLPLAETTQAKTAVSSQPPRTHLDTALHVHRMTGGGRKYPSKEAGPIATNMNPARFAMMIQGRPVVALRVVEAARRFQSLTPRQSEGRPGFSALGLAITPLTPDV